MKNITFFQSNRQFFEKFVHYSEISILGAKIMIPTNVADNAEIKTNPAERSLMFFTSSEYAGEIKSIKSSMMVLMDSQMRTIAIETLIKPHSTGFNL